MIYTSTQNWNVLNNPIWCLSSTQLLKRRNVQLSPPLPQSNLTRTAKPLYCLNIELSDYSAVGLLKSQRTMVLSDYVALGQSKHTLQIHISIYTSSIYAHWSSHNVVFIYLLYSHRIDVSNHHKDIKGNLDLT